MRRRKRRVGRVVLLLLLLFCIVVVFGVFRVRELVVIGNEFYTDEQIEEAIMEDGLCKNTLYLLWKFQDEGKVQEAVPFLSNAEAEMISPYEVQVRVYEKSQIGYLMFQGSYVYFDQDGIVVEVSDILHEDVPCITGLDVESVVLYEQLPVRDESLYNTIMTLTKNLSNHALAPEEIRFGINDSVTLIFGDIKVSLGSDSALEDKIAALVSILSQLEGESGILYMDSFEDQDGMVTFKSDEGDRETFASEEEETQEEEAEAKAGTPETQPEGGRMYAESDGTFSTDAEGNTIYTDAKGVTTTQCDGYNYTDENGGIIMDGYGYIDPYTGSYIN